MCHDSDTLKNKNKKHVWLYKTALGSNDIKVWNRCVKLKTMDLSKRSNRMATVQFTGFLTKLAVQQPAVLSRNTLLWAFQGVDNGNVCK